MLPCVCVCVSVHMHAPHICDRRVEEFLGKFARRLVAMLSLGKTDELGSRRGRETTFMQHVSVLL